MDVNGVTDRPPRGTPPADSSRAEPRPPLIPRGNDIVCVGYADWEGDIWTNQHHLMARLARTNRVLFVESLGLRRPHLVSSDVRRIARRLQHGVMPPRWIDGLHALSPLVIPFHGSATARRINAFVLPRIVSRAAKRLGMSRPILWAYAPQAEALLDELDPSLVVYHCVDDVAAQKGVDRDSFREAERRLASRADLVLASAPALAERMRALSSRVVYAPNVADTALFARALEPGQVDPGMERLAKPRIVFTGAVVATKLDVGLLVALARLRPRWSFALVGPTGTGDPSTDVSALKAEPNIHLLGGRRYVELPAVLRGADAALIPYAINELTSSVFPMKVYEYLAAGLPVVSTALPALREVEGIAIEKDPTAIVARLDAMLSTDDRAARRERSRRAAQHSWDRRMEEIGEALDQRG